MLHPLFIDAMFKQLLDFLVLFLIEKSLSFDDETINFLKEIFLSLNVETLGLYLCFIVFAYLSHRLIKRKMAISTLGMFIGRL